MNTHYVRSECTTFFKWRLDNFSKIAARDDSNKQLASYAFKLDSSSIKCYLVFYPTNINDENKNYSSLYFVVENFGDKSSIKIRLRLWLENQLGDLVVETNGRNLYEFQLCQLFFRNQR